MAKSKLRIADIQKALLTSTRYIKEQDEEVVSPVQKEVPPAVVPTPKAVPVVEPVTLVAAPVTPPVEVAKPAPPAPAPEPEPQARQEKPVTAPVAELVLPEVLIDPKVMKKLKILATYQKTTPNELINAALDHYLRLKSMQLEEAMHKLTME